jgi:hypothetical protein
MRWNIMMKLLHHRTVCFMLWAIGVCFFSALALWLIPPGRQAAWATGELTGCVAGASKQYPSFQATDFSSRDDALQFDASGHLVLNTGKTTINKEKIKVSSTQEVKVSLLFEGGCNTSSFGYFLLSKAITKKYLNATGTALYYSTSKFPAPSGYRNVKDYIQIGTGNFDSDTFHYIFRSMSDQTSVCDDGGDGVLDSLSGTTEMQASTFDDGTPYRFAVNGDGALSIRDMTKNLGMIAENEEIVFFLVSNNNYDQIYFNKTAFNPDTYTSTTCSSNSVFSKKYLLGQPRPSTACKIDSTGMGWLNAAALTRLSSQYGIAFSSTDSYTMEFTHNQPYSHLIIGAPANDPTQWILGWEDLAGGGDTDHNDIVFKIQRKTEGRAVSKVLSSTLYASGTHNSYITAVNIEATDVVKNCVSGVVPSVNTTFATGDFSTPGWPDCPNQTDQVCPVQCGSETHSGSLVLSNASFSGDINDEFTLANLSAQGLATANLNFSSCQRPPLPAPVCSTSSPYTSSFPSFPYTFTPTSLACRTASERNCSPYVPYKTSNTFSSVPIGITMSGQNLSINSSGAFSGSFLFNADNATVDNLTNDGCFQSWLGSLNKTISLSGTLNGDWKTRKNDILYEISVDNGTTWTSINDWDSIVPNGDGSTTKKVRIDLLSLGLVGDQLKWKAIFQNNDDQCLKPQLHAMNISYEASGNNTFSRASPVVLGNVLYSGSVETPALSWPDKTRLRGHLKAYRIYDPTRPTAPAYQTIWDAGDRLDQRNLVSNPRRILTAMPSPQTIQNRSIATGNGYTLRYTGTLPNGRILASSLIITDGVEIFNDRGVNTLVGDKGGAGTINRFTGAYDLTFHQPPATQVPITASCSYYPSSGSSGQVLGDFSADYITNGMLGITAEYVEGTGYTYDFKADGNFTDADRRYLIGWVKGMKGDNATGERSWPLDAIDHSTPVVAGPPGLPVWYYGSGISSDERDAYNTWVRSQRTRRSVAYVGSRSGMLHALDAGAFRNGDNPATTTFLENRGYFTHYDNNATRVDYGSGDELWAFIPNNCLSRLKYQLKRNLAGADPPYVDASPSVEDVYYQENGSAVFKTVLFSAEGNGGDTIFALDITDPANPLFLWEYGDPALWRSKSSPPIGKIARLNTGGQAKWVVFFVSGQTAQDQHPAIFMVDALTGALLQKIVLDRPGSDNLGAVLSGSPALLDANGNGYIDRLYVGDDKGFIYRVNIPDGSGTTLTLDQILQGIADYVLVRVSQPVYASPVVYPRNSFDAGGQISRYHVKIMFGTGDNPNFNDNPNYSGTLYKFFVFDDTCPHQDDNSTNRCVRDGSIMRCCIPYAGDTSTSSIQSEANAEWTYTLPAGQRIWAEAFAAAGVVYFGTATSDTEDPCALPTTGTAYGSVYSLNLNNLPLQSTPTVVASNIGNVMGLMVEDRHLYLKATVPTTGTSLNSFGSGIYNNEVAIGIDFGIRKLPGSWRQVIPLD